MTGSAETFQDTFCSHTETSPSDSHSQLLEGAVRAAHSAGRILMRHFRSQLTISEKEGAGFVTNADYEAENAILKVLKRSFPNFGFLTEESSPEAGQVPGRWIIDPLDGTSNYLHGLPTFCVSIAAEWRGETIAAVIFHPCFKETYTAIRGAGAFVNGKRIQVSSNGELAKSFLSTGFSARKETFLAKELTAFEKMSRVANAVRRPGSAALDLAYVARGSFDGYWERGLSAWDVAAGKLLVEEAGGRVTDFSGSSSCLDAGEVLASNGLLHEQMLLKMS